MGKQAILFPGQGSQYKGMLADYVEKSSEAKEKLQMADQILGYSISDIMADLDSERLVETRYTQPALYIHSTLAFDIISSQLDCSGVAGHSVGEFAALYAARVYDWQTGLKLVAKRGQLMFHSGEKKPGTMFAVVGADDDKVNLLCKELSETGNGNIIVAANFNSPGQVVVSGDRDYLRESAPQFKEIGAKIVKELNVSGAFHSPLLNDAKAELAKEIENAEFHSATIDVYQNIDAKANRESAILKKNLVEQLTGSVLWSSILKNMESDGYTEYIEIGPGKVLQGLTKRTITADSIVGIDKYQDILNFNR